MRRRKLRWVVAGLAVLLLAAIMRAPTPQPSRILRKSFNRLADGMSRAEVEAILGPPGDYRTIPTAEFLDDEPIDMAKMCTLLPQVLGDPGARTELWEGDEVFILVTFSSSSGKVSDCMSCEVKSKSGLIDTFLWRAKRQWRRWFP
jgi:hypothetical protein